MRFFSLRPQGHPKARSSKQKRKGNNPNREAIFGSIDGMTCSAGLIASLHASPHALLVALMAIAFAEAIGMSAAEWASESETGMRQIITMGAATAFGVLLPGVPILLIGGLVGLGGAIVLGLGMAFVLAKMRGGQAFYWQIPAVLSIVAVLSALAAQL